MSTLPQQTLAVNPYVLELQLLARVVQQKKSENDIKGSIPYQAKTVQILEDLVGRAKGKDTLRTDSERNALQKQATDARAQLAYDYFKTGQPLLGESSLMTSVKVWEKLEHSDNSVVPLLVNAYEQLQEAYSVKGNPQLAKHMEARKSKLLAKHAAT